MGVVGVISLLLFVVGYGCPLGHSNGLACSGHGRCLDKDRCVCDDGFSGPDCSQRVCPSGRAWFDAATSNTTAHSDFVECSNMGYCNRETGKCDCRPGLTGSACQRTECPEFDDKECAGLGTCLSMREANPGYDDWDADMMFACVCDAGHKGFDCSERECPKGDDPLTPGVDEVQVVDCLVNQGTVTFEFRGQRTDPIPFDASPELVEFYLEKLSTITDVEVFFFDDSVSLCNGTTSLVTFVRDHGDLPDLNFTGGDVFTDGVSSALRPSVASVSGTKEWVECSNHGTCDDGSCDCFTGFTASDGRGNIGNVGDCGVLASNYSDFVVVQFFQPNVSKAPCPRAKPRWNKNNPERAICSGVGECMPDRTCNCSLGYAGEACEFKECPVGQAWFFTEEVRPQEATCSHKGKCDATTGECSCAASNGQQLFEGPACEVMACPINSTTDEICGGDHGECVTMAQLSRRRGFNYSESWDANVIRGCVCDKSEGVFDYNTSSSSYRGPFAYAYTDWTGYTCDHSFCPAGDNPFTWGQNEVQMLNCTSSGRSGTFNLTFRDAVESVEIPWWADPQKVERELERLSTIRDVKVEFVHRNESRNETVCSEGQLAMIEFRSERGDLPLIVVADDSNFRGGSIEITEFLKGSKENVECSAAGICNREIGQCTCLDGFYSGSDVGERLGAVGQRGDCSFRHTSTRDPKWQNPLFQYSYSFVLVSASGDGAPVGDFGDL